MSEETSIANPLLQPGTLWQRLEATTTQAIASGALHSLPTDYEFVEQQGIRFLVRMLVNLARKDEARQQQETRGPDFNPFLPYEPDLFVADLSATHLCLLNKFNVVPHHLLLITRQFEAQEMRLNQADFTALALCLAEVDGLAFYNGGKLAGASQRHKHLQLIPLPFIPGEGEMPIAPILATAEFEAGIGTIPGLPFRHGLIRWELDWADAAEASTVLLHSYQTLLAAVGLEENSPIEPDRQPGAYNLLVTRQWMLLIPRTQEEFRGIPVNALGFSGALLVRNQEQMEHLKAIGPLAILQGVGVGI